VFDKVRVDPQEPDAFGATITFNIPLKGGQMPEDKYSELGSVTADQGIRE
jgi:hypothetical protein